MFQDETAPPSSAPFLALGFAVSCGSSGGDFALTSPNSSLSVAASGSASLSVAATPSGGFHAPVTVAVTGLPTGVTISPATLTLTPGAAQTFTVAASAGAAPGNASLTLTGVSGSLTHTATVALTISAPPPPPPDFLLSVTPATEIITAGAPASQVTLLATAANGFTATVSVAVSGLPGAVTASPATLTLTPGVAQNLSILAAAAAAPGPSTLTFTATSGALTHTATLAITVAAAPPAPGIDVSTYHYDNTRQGLNAAETLLTLANVNPATFGLTGNYPVDGKVDAQPLVVHGLNLQAGGSTRTLNVLYIATEHDTVYALNAATGDQLWKTSLLGTAETTSDSRGCGQIVPEIGITATPVIDRSFGTNGAIFLVAMTRDASGAYHQRLHALNLATGAELTPGPTEITATYPGTGANSSNGNVLFDPAQYAERAGLLLLNGTIYTTWTSHCDIPPYTGWVIGYSEGTLTQSTVLNLTPNGSDGAVWMSGYGLAADTAGSIYLLDANGTLDTTFTPAGFPSRGDFGNAILKLGTAGGLSVLDFFEPYNTLAESAADVDLGSGGAMLLPDIKDNAGATHHLVVGAGKDRNIYVADRDNLGKYNGGAADNSNLYQELPNALPNGAWSGPAYFNNTVFFAGVNDNLKAYTVSNGLLSTSPTSQSPTSFGYPGSTPSVSANAAGNGIVWAVQSSDNAPAVLHAYDAANLGHELYNSTEAPGNRDAFGTGNKFITPVIANGQVFVGTPNSVAVFGLLR